MFSRAWHWLHVFPRLALFKHFPRLALVKHFPALGTGYMFSRAWHWLHVFPRLAHTAYFLIYVWHFLVLHVYTEQIHNHNSYLIMKERCEIALVILELCIHEFISLLSGKGVNELKSKLWIFKIEMLTDGAVQRLWAFLVWKRCSRYIKKEML